MTVSSLLLLNSKEFLPTRSCLLLNSTLLLLGGKHLMSSKIRCC
jgi:hypothetical protein